MFLTNDFADKDKAMQLAMASYLKSLKEEAQYRRDVREGRQPIPQPATSWNISDRH